jgi:twitching motility two-component system response regulator PilH
MNTVLLVEDSPTHRTLISAILKKNGLSVIEACDGMEALEKVQSYRPDVIILDILMPRMNGYEVCRRLKRDEKTQNIAVVMFSTKSEECDFFWGSKQGADAYVSKLCHPQELVDTVKQLLRGETLHQPWRGRGLATSTSILSKKSRASVK